MTKQIHLLYLTAESWPTFRPDVVALFGKYLPRYGITCDLVTDSETGNRGHPIAPWSAGEPIVCNTPTNRAGRHIARLWHQLRTLIADDARTYTAIQVRDMSVSAVIGLLVARFKGIKFYYWLSYPQSEGQIDRARARGLAGGMRFWFPLIQGHLGRWLLYKVVLPNADHVFVQSRQMQHDLAQHGIAMNRMTPIPMGVDLELTNVACVKPAQDDRLQGRRVIAYLGTLDPIRQIDLLLRMTAAAKIKVPKILLVVVGSTDDAAHENWLRTETIRLQITDNVLWLGWLPASAAWRYVRTAEIGLSPIPRGYLLDMGSPTKAVEYMALGLPVVGNNNPDQAEVIGESRAGLCVALNDNAFADAVVSLLNDPITRQTMGLNGRAYVAQQRGYDNIASSLAKVYQSLESQ